TYWAVSTSWFASLIGSVPGGAPLVWPAVATASTTPLPPPFTVRHFATAASLTLTTVLHSWPGVGVSCGFWQNVIEALRRSALPTTPASPPIVNTFGLVVTFTVP